ncbi:hypothetical protein RJT34_28682 [Clitoria ternatea]|uniref:Uncharacterized protein n=1 Tax=Clitoria ternatea TaxID=43366 RepID=A0AAN9IAF4_CLITE
MHAMAACNVCNSKPSNFRLFILPLFLCFLKPLTIIAFAASTPCTTSHLQQVDFLKVQVLARELYARTTGRIRDPPVLHFSPDQKMHLPTMDLENERVMGHKSYCCLVFHHL